MPPRTAAVRPRAARALKLYFIRESVFISSTSSVTDTCLTVNDLINVSSNNPKYISKKIPLQSFIQRPAPHSRPRATQRRLSGRAASHRRPSDHFTQPSDVTAFSMTGAAVAAFVPPHAPDAAAPPASPPRSAPPAAPFPAAGPARPIRIPGRAASPPPPPRAEPVGTHS